MKQIKQNRLRMRFSGLRPTYMLIGMQVVTAATAYGVSVLAAVVMTPDERGELALWLQISYLVTTVAMLGLERPVSTHTDGTFLATVQFLTRLLLWPILVLGTVAVIAAATMAFIDEGRALALFIVLCALFAAGNIWARSTRIAYIVSKQWAPYVGATVSVQLLILGFAIIFVHFKISDVMLWATAYTAATLCLVLVLLSAPRRRSQTIVQSDLSTTELRRSGLALMPASLGNTAMLRSDRLLLPLLSSSGQLGYYIVVATATELAAWPVQQYADASLRSLKMETAASLKKDFLRILKATAIGAVFSLGAVGVSIGTIVLLLPAYTESLTLLAPLAVAATIYSGSRMQQAILIARQREKAASAVEIVGMAASLALYVMLIPSLGALGAALGSLIGYCIAFASGILILTSARVRRPQ